jgi:cytochrome P450
MNPTEPVNRGPHGDPHRESDLADNQWLALRLQDDDLRPALMKRAAHEKVLPFCSADHPLDDPAPNYSRAPDRGHRKAWLVAGAEAVAMVLRDAQHYGNAPYAEIGGGSFMLALEADASPGAAAHCPAQGEAVGPSSGSAVSAHLRQKCYAAKLLRQPGGAPLSRLVHEAVRQAGVAALQGDRFDLASFAEQAAVRFCGLAFGFAGKDHALLQAAGSAGYRALVHQIVGRHFTNDPTVLPQARQALALLTQRASALIEAYRHVAWKPRQVHGRLPHRKDRAGWPEGVDPPGEWGLSEIGDPWLKRMALEPGDFSVQELATMAVGLVVGTIGNVQASVCLVLQQFFEAADRLDAATRAARTDPEQVHQGPLAEQVDQALACQPPVAFLPRRVTSDVKLHGHELQAGDDVILWLRAAAESVEAEHRDRALPFGLYAVETRAPAPHGCPGAMAGRALVTAIVGEVLRLPSVGVAMDPVTGERQKLRQRWGFACESYPLEYRRSKRLAQQPLNVVMRVKAPLELHAEALRRVIRIGAPRIERALKQSRHVHFAWFELLDQGRWLALHTVYDGNFDAYVQHFALKVDDLFDQLFEHIEGAPPLPVGENPGAFVDVIRAHNAAPAEGYFFSAYPETETAEVLRQERNRS